MDHRQIQVGTARVVDKPVWILRSEFGKRVRVIPERLEGTEEFRWGYARMHKIVRRVFDKDRGVVVGSERLMHSTQYEQFRALDVDLDERNGCYREIGMLSKKVVEPGHRDFDGSGGTRIDEFVVRWGKVGQVERTCASRVGKRKHIRMYPRAEIVFCRHPTEVLKVLTIRFKGEQADLSVPGNCYGKESDIGADVYDVSAGFRQFSSSGDEMPVDNVLV